MRSLKIIIVGLILVGFYQTALPSNRTSHGIFIKIIPVHRYQIQSLPSQISGLKSSPNQNVRNEIEWIPKNHHKKITYSSIFKHSGNKQSGTLFIDEKGVVLLPGRSHLKQRRTKIEKMVYTITDL